MYKNNEIVTWPPSHEGQSKNTKAFAIAVFFNGILSLNLVDII